MAGIRWRLNPFSRPLEYNDTEWKQMQRIRAVYASTVINGPMSVEQLPRWFQFNSTNNDDKLIENRTPMCNTSALDYTEVSFIEQFASCNGKIADECQEAGSFILKYRQARADRFMTLGAGYPNDPTHMTCSALLDMLVDVAKTEDFTLEKLEKFNRYRNFIESLNQDTEIFPEETTLGIANNANNMRKVLAEVHIHLETAANLILAKIHEDDNGKKVARLKNYIATIKNKTIPCLSYLQSVVEMPNLWNLKALEDKATDLSSTAKETKEFYETTLPGIECAALLESFKRIDAADKKPTIQQNPNTILDKLALTVQSNPTQFVFDETEKPESPTSKGKWQSIIALPKQKKDIIFDEINRQPGLRNEIHRLMGLLERMSFFSHCCAQAESVSKAGGAILLNLFTRGSINQMAADGEEITGKIIECFDDIFALTKKSQLQMIRASKKLPPIWEKNYGIALKIYNTHIRPSLVSSKTCFREILENAEYWQKNATELLEQAVEDANNFTSQVQTVHQHLQSIGLGKQTIALPPLSSSPSEIVPRITNSNDTALLTIQDRPLAPEPANNRPVIEDVTDLPQEQLAPAAHSNTWRLKLTSDLILVFSQYCPTTPSDARLRSFNNPNPDTIFNRLRVLKGKIKSTNDAITALHSADIEQITKAIKLHLEIIENTTALQKTVMNNQAYEFASNLTSVLQSLNNNLVALKSWQNVLQIQSETNNLYFPKNLIHLVAVEHKWYHNQPIYSIVKLIGDIANLNPFTLVACTSGLYAKKFLEDNKNNFELANQYSNNIDEKQLQLSRQTDTKKGISDIESMFGKNLEQDANSQQAISSLQKIIENINNEMPYAITPFRSSRRHFLLKLKADCYQKIMQIQLSIAAGSSIFISQQAKNLDINALIKIAKLSIDCENENHINLKNEKKKFSFSFRKSHRQYRGEISQMLKDSRKEHNTTQQKIYYEIIQKMLMMPLHQINVEHINFLKKQDEPIYQRYVQALFNQLCTHVSLTSKCSFKDTIHQLERLKLNKLALEEIHKRYQYLLKQNPCGEQQQVEKLICLRWLSESSNDYQFIAQLLEACKTTISLQNSMYKVYTSCLTYLCNIDKEDIKNQAKSLLVNQLTTEIMNNMKPDEVQRQAIEANIDIQLNETISEQLKNIFTKIANNDYFAIDENKLEKFSIYLANNDPLKILTEFEKLLAHGIQTCSFLETVVINTKNPNHEQNYKQRYSTVGLIIKQMDKLSSKLPHFNAVHTQLENLRSSHEKITTKAYEETRCQRLIEYGYIDLEDDPSVTKPVPTEAMWQDYCDLLAQIVKNLKEDNVPADNRKSSSVCANIILSMRDAGRGDSAKEWQERILSSRPSQSTKPGIDKWLDEFRKLLGITTGLEPVRQQTVTSSLRATLGL